MKSQKAFHWWNGVVLGVVGVSTLAIFIAVPRTVETPTPVVVGSRGYINPTALTAHTTAAFNSLGSSTLVAFVSSHPSWNGQPVSISGLSDNLGNTWNLLVGPSTWTGKLFPMLSALYYVNVPAGSTTHTLTVHLANSAPLVVHVFAVSGSDGTEPPVYSDVANPGAGKTSVDVTTPSIAVPANTLLLGWAKNESPATAKVLDGYTLDAESTSFLWAESKTVFTAGSYTGHFKYRAAIGSQTALVGLKPRPERRISAELLQTTTTLPHLGVVVPASLR